MLMRLTNADKRADRPGCVRALFVLLLVLLLTADSAPAFASEPAAATPESLGATVYSEKCANCHGVDGLGVDDEYDEPLFGDRSIESLTRLITRTMPEDDPESCVGDEARRVAEYIYDEFYSLEARQRKGLAPRIELTRLTVPQYRNSVADLLGHFTPEAGVSSNEVKAGLRGQYFQSKGMNKADKLHLERVDRSIDFDFGEGSPSEEITADQFSIIWDGSLIAQETGHYEFRICTPNGVRLYLNSENTGKRRKMRDDSSQAGQSALIDAWVSSGEIREHTARLFLLGGRRYPLRLEFFKYKEKLASIKMEWKRPHGAWAVFDHRFSKTASVARTFVVDTSFPADDRSLGYERGNAISEKWHSATTGGAVETAFEVIKRLPLLAGYDKKKDDSDDQLKDFVAAFASVAFRRPLTDEENNLYRNVLFAEAANSEAAVRGAVLLILTSASFLYIDLPPEDGARADFAVASRLSFALWDSIPDEVLMNAARNGKLTTPQEIESHARRMIDDPRTRSKMRRFFEHWLELEERDLAKDKDRFPGFDETTISDLRDSLELFLDRVLWSGASDYRQLLLSDYLMLNASLRDLYSRGEDVIGDSGSTDGFEPVVFSPDRRAGVLTHPYLLSAFAYHDNTSPIHRGVFLTRNIMGRGLKPPPVAVAFKNEEFAPDFTMREKITKLTEDKACMACHSIINPLGFALENFDAVGRWRTSDNNKPVNSSSEYITEMGDTLEVRSARDIADFAVSNESAHKAFVTQVFHHLIKQSPYAYGADTVDRLRNRFVKNDFNIQGLLSDITVMTAVHGLSETTVNEPKP